MEDNVWWLILESLVFIIYKVIKYKFKLSDYVYNLFIYIFFV